MGICASCLGSRKKDVVDEDEEAPLFLDDANMHYGSFNDPHLNGQEDPIETQRETEALQRVVARTADNMVDIFEITPQDNVLQPAPAQYTYAGQGARMARYQHLLLKLSDGDDGAYSCLVDWLGSEGDEMMETQKGDGVMTAVLETGPEEEALVGTFADAAAA